MSLELWCYYDSPIVGFERNIAEFKLDVRILFYCLELWKKSFKATSTLCCCNDLRERSKSLLISPLATPSWQRSSSAKWSETYSQRTCWLLTLRGKTKWHQQRIRKPVNTSNTALLQGLLVACKTFVYSLEKAQVLFPYLLNTLGSNLITRAYNIQTLYPLIVGELVFYLGHVWPLLLLVISNYIQS